MRANAFFFWVTHGVIPSRLLAIYADVTLLAAALPTGMPVPATAWPTLLSTGATYQYFLKQPNGSVVVVAAYNNATSVTTDNLYCPGSSTAVDQINAILHVFPLPGIVRSHYQRLHAINRILFLLRPPW